MDVVEEVYAPAEGGFRRCRSRSRESNCRLAPMRALAAFCLVAVSISSSLAAEPSPTDRLVADLGLKVSPTPVREDPAWRKPRKIVVFDRDGKRAAWLAEAVPGPTIVDADSPADAMEKVRDADVFIGFCTHDLVEAGKELRWIQVLYAGVERCVPELAGRERPIVLTNMQRVAGPVMAEHVMALVLALARGLPEWMRAQEKGEWSPDLVDDSRMWTLDGRTMLVVGLGGIGTEVAKRAHALGMKVVATRASGRTGPDFVSYVGLPDELPKLAAAADVVVNATPLTPQTTGLFDAKFFSLVKRGALFVNVGRGRSVVTDALVAALEDGRIGGAGLDVTDPEPLPKDHALWSLPNVIVTPHVSSSSDLGRDDRWEIVRENLRRYAAGEPLISVVDVKKGY
jgi:phosphoglycerate dehydrogenase-like enzyme